MPPMIMHQSCEMAKRDDILPMFCTGQSLTCSSATPRKTGTVYTLQGRRKIRVRLSVYYNHFERFAVLSQDKVLCRDCGYINLRNCVVRETSDNGFLILPKDCDGNVLTFMVPSSQEAKDWLQALNMGKPQGESPVRPAFVPRQGTLPLTPKKKAALKRQPTLLPALEEE